MLALDRIVDRSEQGMLWHLSKEWGWEGHEEGWGWTSMYIVMLRSSRALAIRITRSCCVLTMQMAEWRNGPGLRGVQACQ